MSAIVVGSCPTEIYGPASQTKLDHAKSPYNPEPVIDFPDFLTADLLKVPRDMQLMAT